MIDKKIGIFVVILAVIASGCLFAGKTTPAPGTITASPTATLEPTIAPVGAESGSAAGGEVPDMQSGAPSENLDLGSLI